MKTKIKGLEAILNFFLSTIKLRFGYLLLCFNFGFVIHLQSQVEFETYTNGFIYSENTMNRLSRIVDSLNLKYKSCDRNKVYYSKSQTLGNTVKLENGNIKEAIKEMEKNTSFETFIKKFPEAKIEKQVLIVKYSYVNYQEETITEFSAIDIGDGGYGIEIQKEDADMEWYNKAVKNTWLFHYYEKSEYEKEGLTAFFFPENFTTRPLNATYSRMIGYSDCLVDTSTSKFFENTEEGNVSMPKNWQKLNLDEKEKLLEKMRSTRVVGYCSMDSRPREHAVNIALLSAETTNWEVFLRAHLDIMNDRFDRRSDGNYAWAQRKTYLKELEEIDIIVIDLIMGITLRVENPAKNHYYGNLGRIGRALTESADKIAFEKQILGMIADDDLDNYNRVIAYYLFRNYIAYLEAENEKKEGFEKLAFAVSKLPDYMKDKVNLEQD